MSTWQKIEKYGNNVSNDLSLSLVNDKIMPRRSYNTNTIIITFHFTSTSFSFMVVISCFFHTQHNGKKWVCLDIYQRSNTIPQLIHCTLQHTTSCNIHNDFKQSQSCNIHNDLKKDCCFFRENWLWYHDKIHVHK